jgi:chitin disaccharide deacetylase
MIIVNADDWGRSPKETDVALNCYRACRITSVTAMMFMADSERAADIALSNNIPVGLHINLNEPFTGKIASEYIRSAQTRISEFLNRNKYMQLLHNPFLAEPMRDVFNAQLEEFCRLYRRPPSHFDGHQHMHLCTSMLIVAPIPHGQKIRRSFSFENGEKSFVNRSYRACVNRRISSRYHLTDYFFALSQRLQPEDRFTRVCALARNATVELMTHPIVPEEQAFLMSDRYAGAVEPLQKGSFLDLQNHNA